jgi:Lipid A 3-O-deacylase (PagL)
MWMCVTCKDEHPAATWRVMPAVFVLLLSASTLAPADEAAADHYTAWGLVAGYGVGVPTWGSAEDLDVATYGLRWSRMGRQRREGKLRGRRAIAAELLPGLVFFNDRGSTTALGFDILYEYRFAGSGRVLPTWSIGAGILYAEEKVPEGTSRFNFSLVTAFGIDVLLSKRTAFLVEYRLRHVSNAHTADLNPGLNTHSLGLGVTIYPTGPPPDTARAGGTRR